MFINATQHTLNNEQIQAVAQNNMGQLFNLIDIIGKDRYNNIANDNGDASSEKLAKEIQTELESVILSIRGKSNSLTHDAQKYNLPVSEETIYIHFPLSSPRVMAAFFKWYGSLTTEGNHMNYRDFEVWKNVEIVFSYTKRNIVEEGNTKKVVFSFEKFLK